jgi:hypothetical protein
VTVPRWSTHDEIERGLGCARVVDPTTVFHRRIDMTVQEFGGGRSLWDLHTHLDPQGDGPLEYPTGEARRAVLRLLADLIAAELADP